jgi:ParB family chromosome partitioning protein
MRAILINIIKKYILMEKLRVEDKPLEQIVLGKSQARQSELEKGLEDLMASMAKWGLLEPITVFLNDQEKYEILAGQRRYSAAKKLNWPTIPCIIRSKPDDEFQAKAISLTENVNMIPMTEQDIKDACDMLYKRYNSVKQVADAIGSLHTSSTNMLNMNGCRH